MIDEFEPAKNNGNEPLYPYTFIGQYANNTKRFIDDIVTVSLGSQSNGAKVEEIVKQDGNIRSYQVECTRCMLKMLVERK